jgi:hypothetical protein
MKVRYTVPSDASRVGYSTNGSTTVFSVPFVFFDDTDLQVILVNNATAVETTLTLTTNYTVTGGDGSTGSLTTVSTYASGSTLVIQREVPYTQEIDYQANDGFPAEVNEEGLDRATMQVQQVRRRARQTPKLPATYDPESGDISFPLPVSGKVLAGNSDEDGWENVDAFEGGTDLPTLISTIQDLDLLEYNSSGSVWRNRTLAQVLGNMLTTAGDILRRGASAVERVAVGTAGQVLTVVSGQPAWADGPWSTGDLKWTWKATADTGWVILDDGTIGNASSGGTTRANADTSALFTLLWTNFANAQAAVSTGRGASAAADFAANKTIALPKALGRLMGVAGAGSGLTSRTVGVTVGTETHTHTGTTGNENGGTFSASSAGINVSNSPHGHAFTTDAGSSMPPSTFWRVMVKL